MNAIKKIGIGAAGVLGSVAAMAQTVPTYPALNFDTLTSTVSTTLTSAMTSFMPLVGALVAISIAYGLFRRFVG